MGVIDDILNTPSAWTGGRVLDELPLRIYEDARRNDPTLPGWLRDIIVLCDFDTHVQMEGLLGWWENAAGKDLGVVSAAFESVGMHSQADVLAEAERVLPAHSLGSDDVPELSISSFAQRHPSVGEAQYARFRDAEERLYLNDPNGPDLYLALVAHADRGLISMG